MEFIEAGMGFPKENRFRRLLPKEVLKTTVTVGKKVHTIYQKSKESGGRKGTKGNESLTSGAKSTPFIEGFPLEGDISRKKISKNNNPGLGPIPVKSVKIEDTGPSIDTIKLMGTSRKIKDIEKSFSVPYKTTYYNGEGKGHQGVPKGTQIEYSSPTIFSLYDAKTSKYQAYAKVKTFTKSTDTSGNDFESVPSGYIRAQWFDGVINRKDPVFVEKTPEKKSDALSFAGYLGPDGREIPAYILKAVTVNYFGKKIVPKVAETIQKTNQKISKVRAIIKNECLNEGKTLKETSVYNIQINQLAEKGKMESLHTSLTEFTLNNGNIYDANTVKIMNSVQKSTDWELIKQQAAFVYRQKRIGK